MQINWCYKGIFEGGGFGDAEAREVLSRTGIRSAWMIDNESAQLSQANVDWQNVLNANALDNHINNYVLVRQRTPYISMSAGCVEFAGGRVSPIRYAAFRTALDFATDGGKRSGYIFRCWVLTSPKPAPELPGFAEETRDLNLFAHFYRYHMEGEVTAKVVVPRRQVQWVLKVDPNLRPVAASWATGGASRALRNSEFIWPSRVSNVVEAI